MDMTEKLYDVNAYLTEFDAAVVSCQVLKEGTERDVNGQLEVGEAARPDAPLWEVALDRSALRFRCTRRRPGDRCIGKGRHNFPFVQRPAGGWKLRAWNH